MIEVPHCALVGALRAFGGCLPGFFDMGCNFLLDGRV